MDLSVNNVNFKANLDVRYVKGSKARWKNIAKKFAKITSESKDVFQLEGSFAKGLDFSGRGHKSVYNGGWIQEEATGLLKKLSDTEIAKKLKDLYLLQKKSLKITRPIWKYLPEDIDAGVHVSKINYALIDYKFGDDAIFGLRDHMGERVVHLGN